MTNLLFCINLRLYAKRLDYLLLQGHLAPFEKWSDQKNDVLGLTRWDPNDKGCRPDPTSSCFNRVFRSDLGIARLLEKYVVALRTYITC